MSKAIRSASVITVFVLVASLLLTACGSSVDLSGSAGAAGAPSGSQSSSNSGSQSGSNSGSQSGTNSGSQSSSQSGSEVVHDPADTQSPAALDASTIAIIVSVLVVLGAVLYFAVQRRKTTK